MKEILQVTLLVILFSCSDGKTTEMKKKANEELTTNKKSNIIPHSHKKDKADSIIISKLNFDDFSLMVKSEKLEMELDYEKNGFVFQFPFRSQVVEFYDGNRSKFRHEVLVDKVLASFKDGKEYMINEIQIQSIQVLKNDRGNIYFLLIGGGGCSWCKEYNELLDVNGKTLHLNVSDHLKTYQRKGKEFDVVLRTIGIELKDINNGKFSKLTL